MVQERHEVVLVDGVVQRLADPAIVERRHLAVEADVARPERHALHELAGTVRVAEDRREVGGRNARDVDLVAQELEPGELAVHARRFDDAVEEGPVGAAIARVPRQHDALAAPPLAQHERAAADRLVGEVVAERARAFGRDDRGEEQRELVEEEMIGRRELDRERRRVERAKPRDVRRRAVDELGGADDAAVVLGALRARLRIEDALQAADGVPGGERRAVREHEVRQQLEAVRALVGTHRPAFGERRHDPALVVVGHERLEEVLLEGPRARVVAEGGVERRDVVGRGDPEDAAALRALRAFRPRERRVAEARRRRHGEHERHEHGRERPSPRRRHRTALPRSASPYAIRLNARTA